MVSYMSGGARISWKSTVAPEKWWLGDNPFLLTFQGQTVTVNFTGVDILLNNMYFMQCEKTFDKPNNYHSLPEAQLCQS